MQYGNFFVISVGTRCEIFFVLSEIAGLVELLMPNQNIQSSLHPKFFVLRFFHEPTTPNPSLSIGAKFIFVKIHSTFVVNNIVALVELLVQTQNILSSLLTKIFVLRAFYERGLSPPHLTAKTKFLNPYSKCQGNTQNTLKVFTKNQTICDRKTPAITDYWLTMILVRVGVLLMAGTDITAIKWKWMGWFRLFCGKITFSVCGKSSFTPMPTSHLTSQK